MKQMTKELEFIKKAVLKACNPHWNWKAIDKKDTVFHYYMSQPISLDRILRAIIQGERSLATSAEDLKVLLQIIYDWDYDQSTLQKQTEETILSISKLLGYGKQKPLDRSYYWECPRCGTVHNEDVLICNQWTRDGECGYNCNDRPLVNKFNS